MLGEVESTTFFGEKYCNKIFEVKRYLANIVQVGLLSVFSQRVRFLKNQVRLLATIVSRTLQ